MLSPNCESKVLAGDCGVVGLKHSAILVIALALAGCTSNLLGGGNSSGPVAEQSIPVGNQLALPPDLALKAPGATSQNYRANAGLGATDTGVYSDDINTSISGQAAVPRGTTGDVYAKYGISKQKADGTKKDEGQLREELRRAVIAEKRRTNPSYGTIGNIGELFSD
jgi:hypothetical protein